ncbi:retrotransposon protein, putative, ty1-copia subclass [Tanacetum coccineum]
MHNMRKTIGELHALLIKYEKLLPKKAATPQVMAIQGGRTQKANKKSLNAKGKGKGKGKGKDKSYIPKPKNPKHYAKEHLTKDDACHHCKEVGHCKRNCPAYLAELIKKKKQVGTTSSSRSYKSKKAETRSSLFVRGQWFSCTIFKNNVLYFNTIPSDGIYEIDMLNLVPNVNSIYNDSYFITFTDDYSRYDYMYLLKHIHEVFETFKVFKNEVENQLGKTIKALSSDRGGEYISEEFKDYLKACGIRCEALVKRDTPDKLQQISVKCIFIGYPKEMAGYYFYFPPENKIVVARYAKFLEKNLLSQEISGRAEELKEIQDEDTSPYENTSKIPMEVEGFKPPQEEVVPIRMSARIHQALDRLCLNIEVEEHSLGDLYEPTNYKDAMLDPESDKWLDAMNSEMQSMKDNQVWRLVDLPPNCKTVGSKWIFKKKTNMDGIVHTYKYRLIAKGYTQTYRIDYEETFSPVADIRAIRILIVIATFYDYEIWQMDVKTAFLNGYLDEDIYMVQPEGFVDPNHPRKVCKLERSIYGLKQASRS